MEIKKRQTINTEVLLYLVISIYWTSQDTLHHGTIKPDVHIIVKK